MIDDIRAIRNKVNQAARKHKDHEEKKSRELKAESHAEAVSKRQEMENELTREKRDYAKIFYYFFCIVVLLSVLFIMNSVVESFTREEKNIWTIPAISEDDTDSVIKFVKIVCNDSKRGNVIDGHFLFGIPPGWVLNSKVLLPTQRSAKVEVLKATPDMHKIGNTGLFNVECRVDNRNLLMRVAKSGDEFKLMNVAKIPSSATQNEGKRQEETKNE